MFPVYKSTADWAGVQKFAMPKSSSWHEMAGNSIFIGNLIILDLAIFSCVRIKGKHPAPPPAEISSAIEGDGHHNDSAVLKGRRGDVL